MSEFIYNFHEVSLLEDNHMHIRLTVDAEEFHIMFDHQGNCGNEVKLYKKFDELYDGHGGTFLKYQVEERISKVNNDLRDAYKKATNFRFTIKCVAFNIIMKRHLIKCKATVFDNEVLASILHPDNEVFSMSCDDNLMKFPESFYFSGIISNFDIHNEQSKIQFYKDCLKSCIIEKAKEWGIHSRNILSTVAFEAMLLEKLNNGDITLDRINELCDEYTVNKVLEGKYTHEVEVR